MFTKPDASTTNPTIFLRLRASDAQPRELAWDQFSSRYGPIISSFVLQLGGKAQEVDDVVQEVLLGFFLRSPTFVYDSAKGRFRSYLRVCTYRVIHQRLGKAARVNGKPLDQIDPQSVAIEQIWDDVWAQELLRKALEDIRLEIGNTKSFAAFELFVIHDESAADIAAKLEMHVNSVYRAKDEVMRQLRTRLAAMRDED
jgi:RNA polymerase sigma factor (sigma-70 family)